jgi:hypothetical protein
MNKSKTAYYILFFIFVLALLIRVSSFVSRDYKQEEIKAGSIEENIDQSAIFPSKPDWGSYKNLPQDFTLWGKSFSWKFNKPGSEKLTSAWNDNERNQLVFSEQERAVYELELMEHKALLKEAVELRQKQFDLELEGRLKQKENQYRYESMIALEAKEKMQTVELADFQAKIEEDYSSKLASLHFRLEIPDLSSEQKLMLTNEVLKLEQEMKAEIGEKARELEEDLQRFEEERNRIISEELKDYRIKLKQEGEIRFQQEKEKLELELLEWKQRRESEMGFPQENTININNKEEITYGDHR